jgi:hypothetical protein
MPQPTEKSRPTKRPSSDVPHERQAKRTRHGKSTSTRAVPSAPSPRPAPPSQRPAPPSQRPAPSQAHRQTTRSAQSTSAPTVRAQSSTTASVATTPATTTAAPTRPRPPAAPALPPVPSPTPPLGSSSRSPSPGDLSPGVATAFGPRSYWVGGDARLALVRKNAARLLEEWLLTTKPFPTAEALDQVAEPFPTCCLDVLMLG